MADGGTTPHRTPPTHMAIAKGTCVSKSQITFFLQALRLGVLSMFETYHAMMNEGLSERESLEIMEPVIRSTRGLR
jgi:hypothetical protein